MFKIEIQKINKTIFAEEGENLFDALRRNKIPIASSCLGEVVCGKCWIEILEHESEFEKKTEKEKYLLSKENLNENYRLSCCLKVNCNMTINTTYW